LLWTQQRSLIIDEKRGEEDFSFANTTLCFRQRRFCKSSAGRGAEAHHGKCTGLYAHTTCAMIPSWLTGTGSFELCFCLLSPGGFDDDHVTPREDVCNCMTLGRKHFRGERKKTMLQTRKET